MDHKVNEWSIPSLFLAGSITITEHGNSIAGENYSLICNARVTSMPNITWKGPDGRIEQSPSIILQQTNEISESHYTSVIKFAPLQSSHEGNYICEIPLLDSSSFTVTVNGMWIVLLA